MGGGRGYYIAIFQEFSDNGICFITGDGRGMVVIASNGSNRSTYCNFYETNNSEDDDCGDAFSDDFSDGNSAIITLVMVLKLFK